MIPAPHRPHRIIAVAVSFAAPASAPALAGPGPSPGNHIVPCAVWVTAAPAAHPAHEFEVIIRNLAGDPVPGAAVTIDFSMCGADVRIAQSQPPGTTADCGLETVSRTTDVQGRVSFRVIGGGSTGAAPQVGNCAGIYADGVLITTVQVAVYDFDGVSGLTAADLSRWLGDFFACPIPPTYCARSDYNYVDGGCSTQELTAGDLSRWIDAFFVAGGTWETPLCP
jgi:hypothetical protein